MQLGLSAILLNARRAIDEAKHATAEAQQLARESADLTRMAVIRAQQFEAMYDHCRGALDKIKGYSGFKKGIVYDGSTGLPLDPQPPDRPPLAPISAR